MTDKQMIYGIDVRECQHYGKCSTNCYVVDEPCSDNPNCYYKQLARAKEENEKLKNQIKNEKQALQIDIDNLNQACLDLNQENDDLLNKLQAKKQECEALQMSENEAVEIIAELTAYKDVNEDFKTAWEELKAENEELKKIINEAKSSKLDLKSFLVGEAIQNEYEQQLDQLKAENEELKKNLNEGCLQHLTLMTEQQVLLKTLTEIKEIVEIEIECKTYEIENDCFNETRCKALNEHIDFTKQILQKISEVTENENS